MRRKFIWHLIVLVAVPLIVGTGIAGYTALAQKSTAPALVSVRGTAAKNLKGAQLVKAASASQVVPVVIGLKPKDQTGFYTAVNDVNDPKSTKYRDFMSIQDYVNNFAPTVDQVNQVTTYLAQNGFSNIVVSNNRTIITATTTVGGAQTAFHTSINLYKSNNTTFLASPQDLQLPPSIDALVSDVVGLDGGSIPTPVIANTKSLASAQPTGLSPQDIMNAYDITALRNTTPAILGDDQTIALFELDSFAQSDIDAYISQFKLSNTLKRKVSVQTVERFSASSIPGTGGKEAGADLQIISAIAPHANVVVYEGPSNSVTAPLTLFNTIVSDIVNKPRIMSVSWGAICEADFTGSKTLDTILAQAALYGISIFVASGDSGAYACKRNELAVDAFASSPYVTGVGGTILSLNSNGQYSSETAWNDQNDTKPPYNAGSGGGISKTYQQPSWQWGTGVNNTAYDLRTPCKADSKTLCRQVPDVSAVASNIAIYCSSAVNDPSCNGWFPMSGTSLSAPIWAACAALINQYLDAHGASKLGLANFALYGLFHSTQVYAPFHDITQGSSNMTSSGARGYSATAGYDMVTGIGTPDVYNIALDLAHIVSEDSFIRVNQTNWGSASDAHSWGSDASLNDNFTISGNTGLVAGDGATRSAVLGASTVSNAEVLISASTTSFSSGANFGATARWSDVSNGYKAYIDGSNLVIQKISSGKSTVLASRAFTASTNTTYNLRFRISTNTNGNASLSATAWALNDSEPGALTATDTQPLSSGYCGLQMQSPKNSTIAFKSFKAMTV